MENVDVVVIGGGMAGTAAAVAAAQRGARVMLITAAPGATALCCGGWAGVLPDPLAAAFAAVGHPWRATNLEPLPMADGTLRRFDYAAPSHAAADLRSAMVCGVAGLPGFHASAMARLWSELGLGDGAGSELLLPETPRAGWAPASLAARLERDITILADALREQLRVTRAETVILPAIIGLERAAITIEQLQSAVGVRIVEALSVLPSVPGWRLQAALERMLRAHKVDWRAGQVVAEARTHEKLDRVNVQMANGSTLVRAKAFVLATGKFIGGGITAEPQLREPALACPIWIDHLGERFETVEPLTLTNAERLEEQPLLEAGVQHDAEGRPVSLTGGLFYENVWTAGAVRAGVSNSLGRAAAEGWAAGERAAA